MKLHLPQLLRSLLLASLMAAPSVLAESWIHNDQTNNIDLSDTNSKPVTYKGYEVIEGKNNTVIKELTAEGGIITFNNSITLTENGNITFLNNTISATKTSGAYGTFAQGGVFYIGGTGKTLALQNNTGNILFKLNKALSLKSAQGGSLFAPTVNIDTNPSVIFDSNKAEGATFAAGGAIKAGQLFVKNNSEVIFNNNAAISSTGNAFGGAIYIETPYTNLEMESNNKLHFTENEANATSGIARGGAINARNNNGGTSLKSNGEVRFEHNVAAGAQAYGGAYGTTGTWWNSFEGNTSLEFSGNRANAQKVEGVDLENIAAGGAYHGVGGLNISGVDGENSVKFDGNFAYSSGKAYGGAVYDTYIYLKNNTNLTFTENHAQGTTIAYGGAIYVHSSLEISGNRTVSITHNGAMAADAQGGGIYSINNVTIKNNESVVFRGNYVCPGDDYYLNAITIKESSDGSNILDLSAGTGGISIYDSIQVQQLKINESLDKTAGLKNTVLFSGKYTLEDLKNIDETFDPVANQNLVSASRTASATYVTVYTGTLELDSFTLDASNAISINGTACLTLGNSHIKAGSFMDFSDGSSLNLKGFNTITMKHADRKTIKVGNSEFNDGNVLTFDLQAGHKDAAVLAIVGGNIELNAKKATITLTGDESTLTTGDYKLISAQDGKITLGSKFLSGLTLNGLGATSTDQLFLINNNTLYFSYVSNTPVVPSGVWKDGQEINGTVFHNGDSISFENSGTIQISGGVEPAEVRVGGSQNTVFVAHEDGGFIAEGSLVKEGSGSLTIGTSNTYTGETTLKGGGLIATADHALGHTSVIRIQGENTYIRFVKENGGTLTQKGDVIVEEQAKGSLLTSAQTSAAMQGGLENKGELYLSGNFSFEKDVNLDGITQVATNTAVKAPSFHWNSTSATSLESGTTLTGDIFAEAGSSLAIEGTNITLNGNFSIIPHMERAAAAPMHTITFHLNEEMAAVAHGQQPLVTLQGTLSTAGGTGLGVIVDLRSMAKSPSVLQTAFFSDQVDNATRDSLTSSDVRIIDRDGWSMTVTGDHFLFLTGQEGIRLKDEDPNPNPDPDPGVTRTAPRGVGEVATNSLWNTTQTLAGFADTVRSHTMAVPVGKDGNQRVWISSLTSFYNLDNDGRKIGCDYQTNGYVVGTDYSLTREWLLGASFGQTFGKTSMNDQFGSYDQDMILAGLYAQGQLHKDKQQALSVQFFAGYANSDNKGSLTSPDLLNSAYHGSWNDNSWTLDARVQWDYQLNSCSTLSLFAGVQYMDTTQDDFDLTTDGHRFRLSDGSLSLVRIPVGASVQGTVYEHNDQKLSLYATAAAITDAGRDEPSVRVHGQENSWQAEGSNPGSVFLQTGAGVIYGIGDNWTLSAGYQFEAASRFTSHTCRAQVSYSF